MFLSIFFLPLAHVSCWISLLIPLLTFTASSSFVPSYSLFSLFSILVFVSYFAMSSLPLVSSHYTFANSSFLFISLYITAFHSLPLPLPSTTTLISSSLVLALPLVFCCLPPLVLPLPPTFYYLLRQLVFRSTAPTDRRSCFSSSSTRLLHFSSARSSHTPNTWCLSALNFWVQLSSVFNDAERLGWWWSKLFTNSILPDDSEFLI